jgi:hypothetical protein
MGRNFIVNLCFSDRLHCFSSNPTVFCVARHFSVDCKEKSRSVEKKTNIVEMGEAKTV